MQKNVSQTTSQARKPQAQKSQTLGTPLLAALLSSALFAGTSAQATDLTIYPSFAEVRETIQVSGAQFDWTPPKDLSQFLILGSLELIDPSVTSLSLLAAPQSILGLYEGKEVKVWFHDEFVVAKVIKADSFLFEIDGAFVQIGNAEVLYPSLDGLRYAPTFSWQRTGGNLEAQLRYATTAVAWENTRYTLNLQEDPKKPATGGTIASSLNAWADISNQSGVVYEAPKATLFAGDVLPQYSQDSFSQSQNRNINAIQEAPSGNVSSTQRPRVASSGEVSGLQRYEYPQALRLNANSRLSLPFFRSNAAVRRILEYSNGFDSGANFKVGLQRTYRFKALQGLPAGTVTVRENEQLVGQSEIVNTAKDTIVKVSIGKDFDIKLNRSAQILERTRKFERAKIVFTIKNTKSHSVTVRLLETLDDAIKLEASGATGYKRLPGAFTLESEIEPGKTLSLTLLSTDPR
jgi:hypothetical protein